MGKVIAPCKTPPLLFFALRVFTVMLTMGWLWHIGLYLFGTVRIDGFQLMIGAVCIAMAWAFIHYELQVR